MVVVRNIALLISHRSHKVDLPVALNRFNRHAQLMLRNLTGILSHKLQIICKLASKYLGNLQSELQFIGYKRAGVRQTSVGDPAKI